MSLFVKICGLRRADDVAAAVAAGADAVGFVFAPSVRRVTIDEARQASAAAGSALRVAVMRHPRGAEWQAVLEGFEPHVLQTDSEDFAALDVPDSVTRWPVVRETDAADAPNHGTFLYEGGDSGTGETIDWQRAAARDDRDRMILAGGLDAENVATAIAIVRPFGVDVSSGVETEPGVKDAGLIARFIEAARAAEQAR